jgi:exosortase F-associated protein
MKKNHHSRPLLPWKKISLILAGSFILISVYLLQRVNLLGFLQPGLSLQSNIPFIVNKTLRLVLNDAACFIFIYALFQEQKYLRVAFFVFLVELVILLPLYFILKLSIEGNSEISSPLLSQIHRLIINPTLMILLIIGFFYQRLKGRHHA